MFPKSWDSAKKDYKSSEMINISQLKNLPICKFPHCGTNEAIYYITEANYQKVSNMS